MKNKIEFFENEDIQTKHYINQKKDTSYDQNLKKKQKGNTKDSFKVIKGKVKVYNNNSKPVSHKHDDKSELILISNRMLHFVKFTFVLIILLFILFELKKNNLLF